MYVRIKTSKREREEEGGQREGEESYLNKQLNLFEWLWNLISFYGSPRNIKILQRSHIQIFKYGCCNGSYRYMMSIIVFQKERKREREREGGRTYCIYSVPTLEGDTRQENACNRW